MSEIRVSFVIVTWNAADTIRDCVASVPRDRDVEVIVVDNASGDETLETVGQLDREIQVIRMGSNTGFARACNAGVAKASGEFVFFLNPDAVLRAGGLGALIDVLASDHSLFAVAPIETALDDRVVGVGEDFLTLGRLFAHRVLGWKRFRSIKRPATVRRVDWISGAAFVARRNRYQELGGFDERFWMYVEDMDLCWRARRRGWAVATVPGATLIHHHSHSAVRNLERTLKSNAIGTLRWFQAVGTGRTVFVARCILLASLLPQSLACLVRRGSFKDVASYGRVAAMLLSPGFSLARLKEREA